MSITIDEANQQQVNQMRIDLAQALMDLTQVHVHDIHSRQNKEKSIENLRNVRNALDRLGIRHSVAGRYDHGRG